MRTKAILRKLSSAVREILTPETTEIATLKRLDPTKKYLEKFDNPEEILARGAYPYEPYDRIFRDPEVRACMQKRKLAVVGVPYEITPAIEDDPDSERVAEFVRDAISWISHWDRTRRKMLDAILFGFTPFEVIWIVENGQVWADVIKSRPRRNFYFDNDLQLRLVANDEYIGVTLPPRKFMVAVVEPSDEQPYGDALGPVLYYPVWFKRNVRKFALIFCERFASPLPVVKWPTGSSEDQRKKALEIISAIQNESGVAIPQEWVVDLLEATRSGTINVYDWLETRCDREISKTILGETLTTEQGEVGSYALGRVHNEVRLEIVRADGLFLDEVINGTVIRWLVDFNFGVDIPAPIYKTRTQPDEDRKACIEIDKVLAEIVPLPIKDFYQRYGWREPAGGEPMTQPGGAQRIPGLLTGGVATFAEPARFNRILQLEASTLERAPGAMANAMDIVKKNLPVSKTGAMSARRSPTPRFSR